MSASGLVDYGLRLLDHLLCVLLGELGLFARCFGEDQGWLGRGPPRRFELSDARYKFALRLA